MAAIVVRLYADNPKTGTTDFSQVRFYSATNSSGASQTLIKAVNIDTANINPVDPGFTSYLHTTGDDTLYVASSWYNATTTVETRLSPWILQGQDRWDTMFMDELRDTAAAVWTASDRSYLKQKALEALFPDFFYEVIDTSLIVTNNATTQTHSLTIPFGIFYIAEVGIGKPNDQANQPFKILMAENWRFEQNQLNILSLSGLVDGRQIRLIASKKFLEVGEVPRRLDPLVMLHLRMSAYTWLADDYPRFLKWGRLQKGTKITLEGLRALIADYERKFNQEKLRMKELWMASKI